MSSEQRALHERGLRLATAEADLDARAAEAEDLHARAHQDRGEAAQLRARHQVQQQLTSAHQPCWLG